MQTKTVKLKTTDAGGVSFAHSALHPGYHRDQGAFVVAIEHVPTHLPTAAVLTAYRTATVDVSFDGPYRIAWEDLADARPGGPAADCRRRQRAQRAVYPVSAFLADHPRNPPPFPTGDAA